jgi:hypothetical protein
MTSPKIKEKLINKIAPAEDQPERFCFSSEESEVYFCQGLTLFDAIPASVFSCIERLIGNLN